RTDNRLSRMALYERQLANVRQVRRSVAASAPIPTPTIKTAVAAEKPVEPAPVALTALVSKRMRPLARLVRNARAALVPKVSVATPLAAVAAMEPCEPATLLEAWVLVPLCRVAPTRVPTMVLAPQRAATTRTAIPATTATSQIARVWPRR